PRFVAPDHSVYLGTTPDEKLGIFNASTGKVTGLLERPYRGWISGPSFFSANGRLFLEWRGMPERKPDVLYAIPSGKRLCELPNKGVLSAWTSSDDDRLVAFYGKEDGLIHIHDVTTGKPVWHLGQQSKYWL